MTNLLGFTKQDMRTVLHLIATDLHDRYLGSVLGILWAIFLPLMTLCVYAFVFGFLFKARLPGAETTLSYTIWMISGLGPWLAFTESMISGTNSVWAHAGIVKNVPMNTDILPVVGCLMGIVQLVVSMLFLIVLMIVDGNPPTVHALYLFPHVAVQFLFVMSLCYSLSAIAVFLRDLSQVLPNLLMIAMFLTPIFYNIEMMPGPLRMINEVSPLYIISDGYRTALVDHQLPPFWHLPYLLAVTAVLGYGGLTFFRRMRGHFDSAL